MFTGLVECQGTIRGVRPDAAGVALTVVAPTVAADLPMGASVAVAGVCLTATANDGDAFTVQAGPETLRLTTLGGLRVGDAVNLERALRLGDRLGGHLVQGHVDGVGSLLRRERQGEWEALHFACPPELARQMVRKGSVAVDGVSLTLTDVTADGFAVALIPHTLAVTTLGTLKAGGRVNLETDLFGKYILKHLDAMR